MTEWKRKRRKLLPDDGIIEQEPKHDDTIETDTEEVEHYEADKLSTHLNQNINRINDKIKENKGDWENLLA